MNYEDFCTPADAATFKKVKRLQMRLGRVAREEAAAMVGGRITSGKEYVKTRRGLYRLCVSWNSDNSTEREANDFAGAEAIVMGIEEDMTAFFVSHGLSGPNSYATFIARVRRKL